MKWVTFAAIFLLMSCKPYSLNNDRDPRVRDDAKEKTKFEIPDIEDIGLDEVRKNKDSCVDYDNHTTRSVVLGDKSPLNPIINCIAYNIDNGLKPLCETEELAKEELDKTKDDRYAEEIEVFLEELEYEKELFVDYIYEIADPVYDTCADVEDNLDKRVDKIKNNFIKAITGAATDLTLNSECRRVYRVMDSKANLACVQLSFSSFNRKR